MDNQNKIMKREDRPIIQSSLHEGNITAARLTTQDGHVVDALGKNVNFVNHADRMVTEIHIDTPEQVEQLARSLKAEVVADQSQSSALASMQPQMFPAVTNCDYYNLIVAGTDDFSVGRTMLKRSRVFASSYFTEDFIIDEIKSLSPEARQKLYT